MAPRITLRPATRSDLDLLVQFSAALAQETEARTLELTRLRRGLMAVLDRPSRGLLRVAQIMHGGLPHVIGQLMVTYEWSDWRNGMFWWIQSVYVVPSWRHKGVYRAMHEALRREARSTTGVCGLRLYVEEENHLAQSAYRSVGMQPAHYQVLEEDFVWRPRLGTRSANATRSSRPVKGYRS